MAPPWSRRFPLSSSGAAERRSVRACLDSICFLSVFSLDPIANLLFVSRKVRQGRKAVRASCKTYLFISRKVRQVRKVILKNQTSRTLRTWREIHSWGLLFGECGYDRQPHPPLAYVVWGKARSTQCDKNYYALNSQKRREAMPGQARTDASRTTDILSVAGGRIWDNGHPVRCGRTHLGQRTLGQRTSCPLRVDG